MYQKIKTAFILQFLVPLLDIVLINAGFITSFFIRYKYPLPSRNFQSYENTFVFLSIIYAACFIFCGLYKMRFKSSWDLFKKIFFGLTLGTMFSIVFVYVFRAKWTAFPTSIFLCSFFINLAIIFKVNQSIYKLLKRIKKKILVIGDGNVKDLILGKAELERVSAQELNLVTKYSDIDEILISTLPEENMEFITYYAQKLNINVIFSPACYIKLLPERINGNGREQVKSLVTFVSRKREAEELMLRAFDLVCSILILILSLPILIAAAIMIKITSKGPVFYTQERVGKDGLLFKLYKFRTMVDNAEHGLGPVLAARNDPRVTKIGRFLRDTRIDEFPQLINVLLGQMSLVGPRPERPHFVKGHKFLMELRLAIRPGLTGLAQIRKAYDLHPKHKIKYDYLYIQSRSLMLNVYILLKTIPVMVLRKGQ